MVDKEKSFSQDDVNQIINQYSEYTKKTSVIDSELYTKYEVKRGLRDISGKGVLAGLTEISDIKSYILENEDLIPCEGKLYYRGYNIENIVDGFVSEKRYGFEEVTFLLLFGHLPTIEEYTTFKKILSQFIFLPDAFLRDIIMSAPSKNMMNSLAKSVLSLYAYDDYPEDNSIENVVRQSLQLIARFPSLMIYSYQSYLYFYRNESFIIHSPKPEYSIAQNILYMIRKDGKFSELEAKLLDMVLVLHAEHGGGNNSTFTTHVVSSSGTDTYSSIVASICSLKGPKHGGANVKVSQMFDHLKENIKDLTDDDEIKNYLGLILDKQVFDKMGLIYGMGHAVYSLSDPRAEILKKYAKKLAIEKGMLEQYNFYEKIESIAPKVIAEKRKIYKGVSANVDFYSGLIYKMLNLPEELFTPLFAASRISGWSAHRLEELTNGGKIIRPAYKSVLKHTDYVKMSDR